MSDIERAAEDMRLAASSFSSSVDRLAQVHRDLEFTLINHQRFLRSFLEDMEEALDNVVRAPEVETPSVPKKRAPRKRTSKE